MDTALELKISLDKGRALSDSYIKEKLLQSELVKELTAGFPEKTLALVWRLIALSEIPFSNNLDYTQRLIEKIYEKLTTSYGFSLSGDEKMFLPCYNAMIISALCRLGRAHDEEVKKGLEWINQHQPMERGVKLSLSNFNFDRFGGCFNKTPCYIGLAKSVIALQNYQNQTHDLTYESKLRQGIDYMLQHKFFKRLSKNEPINPHIQDISFPESYHLNVVELIRFVHDAGLQNDSRTKDLIDFLKSKQTKDGNWKVNFRYKAEGYIVFDKGKNVSEWVSYILNEAIQN